MATLEDARMLTPTQARDWENELRGRLGLLPRGMRLPTRIRKWSWIVTAAVTLIAAFPRMWNLNHPHAIVFDETYYVKGAYSLLTQGFEGVWKGDSANALFLLGNFSALSSTDPDYVVHPPLGKWIMAIGQALFGSTDALGWRFSTAILGVLSVVLVVRIAFRLFRSPLLAGFTGLAMALDGMGIVLSRTGILDNILAFFVLAGFYAILRDRDHNRAQLAHRVATGPLDAEGNPLPTTGPRVLFRPWLLVAGVLLGLSCGVKWSGIYAIAVFGILAFAWGISARRTVGIRGFVAGAIAHDGLPAFLSLVPIAAVSYLAAWTSWFLNPSSYDRHWAEEATLRGEAMPISWAPDVINSFIHYHQSMWTFHTGLDTPHDYQSQAWEWIFQIRPVSFYWVGTDEMASKCPANKECVQAITSIGNPFVWWFAVIALVLVIWAAFRKRDWRAWAILSGYAAMWLPWMQYVHRTIFQFYAVAFLPFVVLCLTYGIALLTDALPRAHASARAFLTVMGEEPEQTPAIDRIGTHAHSLPSLPAPPPPTSSSVPDPLITTENSSAAEDDSPEENGAAVEQWNAFIRGPHEGKTGTADTEWWTPPALQKPARLTLVIVTGIIVVAALFWMPLWLGTTVSYRFWQIHMWTTTWI